MDVLTTLGHSRANTTSTDPHNETENEDITPVYRDKVFHTANFFGPVNWKDKQPFNSYFFRIPEGGIKMAN